ncbi:hypothetical protein ABTX60_25850 [Streptomyces sp. NPDC126510]|uniref:5'-methylthioadenosine/S-adenosylhomocysteine nucleosidase family protein n=1 Tax=Streptomyces sp. NPDC126510 TaxID=3155317 RepID=UPI00331B7FC7
MRAVRTGGRKKVKPSFGIVTALPHEFAAMKVMLDDVKPPLRQMKGDPNIYVRGNITAKDRKGSTPVVLTLLHGTGNNRATESATHLLRAFKVDYLLMVGIAGGVPNHKNPEKHVRLGDIVVSDSIIQHDYGKFTDGPCSQCFCRVQHHLDCWPW